MKGRPTYPLLIVSNHPRWRVHSQHDDITWIREIETCKVKGPDGYYVRTGLDPSGRCRGRGASSAETWSRSPTRGAPFLAGAYVTERIMPGVDLLRPRGEARSDSPGALDRGGAINTITPHNMTSKNATGMATSGYLVQVSLVDLDELRKSLSGNVPAA